MKRSITLGHADVVTAISAYLVEQGMGEVNEVNFHLDSEGQVTAVAIESEAKASTGRASRTTQKDAVAEEEKPAGRSRRVLKLKMQTTKRKMLKRLHQHAHAVVHVVQQLKKHQQLLVAHHVVAVNLLHQLYLKNQKMITT